MCNAHSLPLVSLVDTAGFMVGPEAEADAQVRHVSRMVVAAAHLRVAIFALVLRKGYGLGAMAMTASGFYAPVFSVAWPSGEFGAIGLESAVRLDFKRRGRPRRARRGVDQAVVRVASTPAERRLRRCGGCRQGAGRGARQGGQRSGSEPVLCASGQWRACSAGWAAS